MNTRWWMFLLTGWLAGCTLLATPSGRAATPTATPLPRATAVATASLTPTPPPPTSTPRAATETPTPTATAPSPTAPAKGLALPRLQPGPVTLLHLRMASEKVGWAVGTQNETHHILHTRDGGLTWQDVSPPRAGLKGMYPATLFLDEARAWVAYPAEAPDHLADLAVVWWTQDAGRNWYPAFVPMAPDDFAFQPGPLVAADATRLWLLVHLEGGMHHDYAALYASQDAGRTWNRVTDPWQDASADLMSLYTNDLAFTPEGYGWATKSNGVAPGGILVVTEDGGVHWRSFNFTPPGADPNVVMCDTRSPHLWAPRHGLFLLDCYGEERSAYLVVVENEEVSYFPLPQPMEAVQFLSPKVGWAWGPPSRTLNPGENRAYLYRTRDGGASWTLVKKVFWWGDFFFLNERLGWALAYGEAEQVLTRTFDGGRTWQMLRPRVAPAGP